MRSNCIVILNLNLAHRRYCTNSGMFRLLLFLFSCKTFSFCYWRFRLLSLSLALSCVVNVTLVCLLIQSYNSLHNCGHRFPWGLGPWVISLLVFCEWYIQFETIKGDDEGRQGLRLNDWVNTGEGLWMDKNYFICNSNIQLRKWRIRHQSPPNRNKTKKQPQMYLNKEHRWRILRTLRSWNLNTLLDY